MMYTIDIETSGLLDEGSIDYSSLPYKLKESYTTHCIVVQDFETEEVHCFYDGETIPLDGRTHEGGQGVSPLEDYIPVEYTHHSLRDFLDFDISSGVIGHNIIGFDLLSLRLSGLLDYTVGPDTLNGKEAVIHDTYVLAKTLNPDIKQGYSLDALGKLLCKARKYEFRKNIPEQDRFKVFAPDMLYYCIQDVKLNTRLGHILLAKLEEYGCHDAYELEKAVKDIVTMQEHRGFKFDMELAQYALKDLDEKMQAIREEVEPRLPMKRMTQAEMKQFTPPKIQFKKDGSLSAHMQRFVERHNAEVEGRVLRMYGKEYSLPLPNEPLRTARPCTIEDTTTVKYWLIAKYGWEPTEWNQRDLTMYSDRKKGKLPSEKYQEAVTRYIKDCLDNKASIPFRCAEHGVKNIEQLEYKLRNADTKRPVYVLTTPSFTVGQQKEMCPNLLKLSEEIPFVEHLTTYLTYRHRRNSIAGGDIDPDTGEPTKGFISQVRASDGRIPTPADSCGTGTSRFTHKGVANIPRTTSLYGHTMRSLFGVGDGEAQIGYDFDGLEARIEGHFCWPFDYSDHTYCNSLIQEKPNDVHTRTAKMISDIINQEFGRTPAKTVKYACAYGAQPFKLSKTIGVPVEIAEKVFNAYWEAAKPLALLKEHLVEKWKTKWGRRYIIGLDGRRIPSRSAHSLVNFLFQNAGVVCAKRAMVIHRDKLKAAGLWTDYFRDDEVKCGQLIAYHDEAQLEVNKNLVKGKVFKTEEEAKEWKANTEKSKGIILSDVKELDNGWFVGYTPAGQLAVEAVHEAGEYYNLHVPLTAGYMLGKNWADCH